MTTETHEPDGSTRPLHIVFGSGGSRAILAGVGFYLLLRQSGIRSWKSIGGVSGGSIIAALIASGITPSKLVSEALKLNFSSLVTKHGSRFSILRAFLAGPSGLSKRPRKGVFSARKIGEYIKSFHHDTWPESYWTMAVDGSHRIIFTENGVLEMKVSGKTQTIHSAPVDISDAICGSCAIPGFLDAAVVNLNDRELVLFDGGLGSEGRCPTSPPAIIHGADRGIVIALSVGDDTGPTLARLRQAWRRIYRVSRIASVNRQTSDVVLVDAHVTHIYSLQFDLTDKQKWQAIMIGYESAFHALSQAGLVTPVAQSSIEKVLHEFKQIEMTSTKPEDFAKRLEQLFFSCGVFDSHEALNR